VHAAGEIVGENTVYHAVALDPGLSFEGLSHNINSEMRLPARPRPGMAFMLVGLVQHIQALRREGRGQLLRDEVGGSHLNELGNRIERVNAQYCGPMPPESCCLIVVKS
jgi:hypothetical protein